MQQNGLNIMDFAKKIQSNIDRKKDLIVPTQNIRVRPDAIEIHGSVHENEHIEFSPTDHFHRQVAAYTDIPWKYYDRVKDSNSDLFANNVNHWLDQKQGSKRMVRTFNGDDNVARAFLSDRYRRIDNEQIAESILPVLMDNPNTKVLSSQVTEKKMYLMVAFANREAEIKKDDVVQAGIIITNSEIGMSRFTVSPYVHRLICFNGMVVNVAGKEYGLKQIHSGRRVDASDNMIAYQDDTIQADDIALQKKMRDIVASISKGPMWDEIVLGMQQAASSEEIKQPIQAVEELAKTVKLNETEQNSVLTNLIKSGDLSRWGAGNAVTAVANEVVDYDRATELQEVGGKVLGMPERDWNKIAEAA